jgi:hypothetical protein
MAVLMYGHDNLDRVPTGVRDDGGEHTIWIGADTYARDDYQTLDLWCSRSRIPIAANRRP